MSIVFSGLVVTWNLISLLGKGGIFLILLSVLLMLYRPTRRFGTSMLLGVNPYFHISILMMILGCMLFLAGFLGELIIRNSQSRNDYLIKEQI